MDNNIYMGMQNGTKLEKLSGWIYDLYFQLQKEMTFTLSGVTDFSRVEESLELQYRMVIL